MRKYVLFGHQNVRKQQGTKESMRLADQEMPKWGIQGSKEYEP